MSQEEQRRRERAEQQRHQLHAGNLQAGGDDNNVKALAQLSQIDLPLGEDDVTETWTSRVNSTAKISDDKRRSHEWEREITLIMALSNEPTEEGLHGSWRGWARGDTDASAEPMSADERARKEAGLQTANLALTRSDEGFVTKESLRGIKQSFVGDEQGSSSSGGLLGKLGL